MFEKRNLIIDALIMSNNYLNVQGTIRNVKSIENGHDRPLVKLHVKNIIRMQTSNQCNRLLLSQAVRLTLFQPFSWLIAKTCLLTNLL